MNRIFCATFVFFFFSIGSAFARSDVVGVIGDAGSFGDWGPWHYCPQGSYAAGYRMKVEPDQRGGDDTAVNGIELLCRKPDGSIVTTIKSSEGKWGRWSIGYANCYNSYLFKVSIKNEPPLGDGGDDTGTNSVIFICQNGNSVQADGSMPWGYWGAFQACPVIPIQGMNVVSVICGLRTRVEKPLGEGKDDTALNGAEFACCPLTPSR